ncbi:MAG: PilZ domain-containing protein [Fibrobacteraceae bacterium]|nr:PilZ domain-containing protein [Fibrobacteraceae bacterium]
MIPPLAILWLLVVAFLLLLLIVLVEMNRNDNRRETNVMFDSDKFEKKLKNFNLTGTELQTLERLVRKSLFSNKDSVLNSPMLFESAVDRFYELYGSAEKVDSRELADIASLRKKLGYVETSAGFSFVSSRQFAVGDFVSISRYDISVDKHAPSEQVLITRLNEIFWAVRYMTGRLGTPQSLVGENIRIRLTMRGEAIYSAWVKVLRYEGDELILAHSNELEKYQLRRWLRQAVMFPVEVDADGKKQSGFLVDLSAGGILLSLPNVLDEGAFVSIRFEIPGFGVENVKIRILRVLHSGRRDTETGLIFHSASFIGEFGETQERVLQYIFEVRKKQKESEKVSKTPSK